MQSRMNILFFSYLKVLVYLKTDCPDNITLNLISLKITHSIDPLICLPFYWRHWVYRISHIKCQHTRVMFTLSQSEYSFRFYVRSTRRLCRITLRGYWPNVLLFWYHFKLSQFHYKMSSIDFLHNGSIYVIINKN